MISKFNEYKEEKLYHYIPFGFNLEPSDKGEISSNEELLITDLIKERFKGYNIDISRPSDSRIDYILRIIITINKNSWIYLIHKKRDEWFYLYSECPSTTISGGEFHKCDHSAY